MPRLKMGADERQSKELLARITSFMVLNGISRKKAAAKCGLSLASWHRRLKKPEEFTIKELRRLGLTVTIGDRGGT